MSISSINTNDLGPQNIEKENLNTEQKKVNINTQKSRDALSSPTHDMTKTAQVSTDIAVSTGKNLNQIVIENTIPNNTRDIDKNSIINRDLGSISTTSAIGTQADKNVPPAEISAKSEF